MSRASVSPSGSVPSAGAREEDANHMATVHHDSSSSDEARRRAAYHGDIFLTSPDAATTRFCDFARELIEDAFGSVDPERAQHHLSVERYVETLLSLKPTFI